MILDGSYSSFVVFVFATI